MAWNALLACFTRCHAQENPAQAHAGASDATNNVFLPAHCMAPPTAWSHKANGIPVVHVQARPCGRHRSMPLQLLGICFSRSFVCRVCERQHCHTVKRPFGESCKAAVQSHPASAAGQCSLLVHRYQGQAAGGFSRGTKIVFYSVYIKYSKP